MCIISFFVLPLQTFPKEGGLKSPKGDLEVKTKWILTSCKLISLLKDF